MRRYIFPVLVGVIGCAILITLGVWQLQRMAWKEAMLADIQASIDAAPVPLPASPDPSMKYLPVMVSGTTTGQEINVLSGDRELGGGYQVVSAFVTDDGRRIMVDRGFVPQQARHQDRPPVHLAVRGNLHWPDEKGSATPDPNLTENIWFARDVPAMAALLDTDPVLVVAAAVQGDTQGVRPIPVAIEGIPNNHLSYAVQWFLIAATWAGMTGALIWRIRQRTY
ncbi:MAG: SURF1 family protein [Paracoccus sp. (in: a-proteobacteria)]|uniref:SURF1 family protein n=1 Tax=Paracoccus sp. TaxID=267 RepID=UPI0026DF88D8|nr:SURF1 family protein [Paracoccus sp. (in: a-proteobacteria)]MDO5632117.1 SURF1 family protein [Paracoccus sp. (in: a-proteobacteria)]